MNRWFRHYAGMARDEKLVRVAIKSKQPIERVIWVWAAILESAAEVNDGGRFDFDAAEAAYFLRADEADIRAVVDGLTDMQRVAGDRVVHWGSRQFESDKSATRQAAYRERKKERDADNSKGDGKVTASLRHGDAPETETETETETEKKKEPALRAADDDPRAKLFGIGLQTIARMTGKTPDSCRSLVGRWLKTVDDEAIHVIAAIEDAERNRIADPVAWITKSLKPRGSNGPNQGSVIAAADRLLERVRAFDEPAPGICDDPRPPPVRAIPAR